jgi:hypothetical protein
LRLPPQKAFSTVLKARLSLAVHAAASCDCSAVAAVVAAAAVAVATAVAGIDDFVAVAAGKVSVTASISQLLSTHNASRNRVFELVAHTGHTSVGYLTTAKQQHKLLSRTEQAHSKYSAVLSTTVQKAMASSP